MNLVEILNRAADQAASKKFLVYEKDSLSFGDFREKSRRFAAGLKAMGVKKTDKVAILLNNSFEFLIAYFGTVMLGAEAVPLNTFLKLDEIVYILDDSKTKIFITSSDFSPVLKDFKSNRMQALTNIVSAGPLDALQYTEFDCVYRDEPVPHISINDNDTAVIIYTSGTTGRPKGAMLTHKNLISNVESGISAIHISKNDRFIIFLPMFHAFSFTVCVLIPLYCMCHLTIIKSIQPFGKIVKALIKDRITIFVAIPTVYNVLASKRFNKFLLGLYLKITPLRVCVSGAAPLAAEVLKKFEEKFKVPLMEGYGLSEASPIVSVNPLDGVRKAGSVGPPIPGVQAEITDENGVILPLESIGEIIVNGPNVMKGYYNKEEETKEIIKDGWLYTGDIGKKDKDGYIYILDRKKDLIITNGMNMYPREVEEVLYSHPAVADASVVGKTDLSHGEIPIGVIKLKEGAFATDTELKKFCRSAVAPFKVPHRFEFWDELPRTGTGKVLKREIRRIINEQR
ncbi:MAG TPA: long-chain-fatty-acid--CoA ligase [bacterium]|nr:long-chain-fatty-acid--CoA ligase [bacterium]